MFFIEDPAYTKHGYYLVNRIKTFSKFEAWQLSGHDSSKIEFIFNDDVFSTYDWSKEPEEDIYELYRRRAYQLRKDYDYIVLIYSGGIDSHTILETFLQNNLRIDEICSFSNNDVQAKTEKFNQEIYNAAIPFVETLDLKKLGTKFRLVNIGQMIIDQLSDNYHFENFEHYSLSTPFWRTAVTNQVLKGKIDDHRKLAEAGKRVCYLWGHDKPSIRILNQEYCITVTDIFSGSFGAKQYNNRQQLKNNFDNFYDEAFYICREFPEISIKQGHMVANFMASISKNDSCIKNVWEIPIFGPYVQYTNGGRTDSLWLSKTAVDKCIYPRALMSRFGDDKLYSGSTLFSKKDNWFHNSNHKNSIKFKQKMDQLIKNNHGLYRYRPNSLSNIQGDQFVFGTDVILGRHYPIRKLPE
jgi:hypothetical protein